MVFYVDGACLYWYNYPCEVIVPRFLSERSSRTLRIRGLQKLTLLDYPGRTACTVFLEGCDFRCPFCHNWSFADPVIRMEKFLKRIFIHF